MTLREAIDKADHYKPNQYRDDDKIVWLSILDKRIFNDVLMEHEPVPCVEFAGYTAANIDDELIAPFPYDDLYVDYLKMKYDEENEDTQRYNNSAIMFNNSIDNFTKYYNKTHKPLARAKFSFWG